MYDSHKRTRTAGTLENEKKNSPTRLDVCKIKQNSKCAKNLKYTIFKTETFVQFSVLVLVLPSSFWGWLLVVGSGLVAGLLFPVFLHNIQLVSLIFFLAETFAQDVDDGGLARSACLPEEMENNLYLDSYSHLYLFGIYIRNKTMSVQLAVA